MGHPSLLTSWTLNPLQLAPVVAIAVAYAVRARTLARKGQPVPGWRIGLFATGIGLLLVALASPVDVLGEEEFFSFHMAQHVLIGDLAPLCFLAGLNGPLLRPLLAFRAVDRLRVFANPLVALPLCLYLRSEAGSRWIERVTGICERRGGLLMLTLPIMVVQIALRPIFPEYCSVADALSWLDRHLSPP